MNFISRKKQAVPVTLGFREKWGSAAIVSRGVGSGAASTHRASPDSNCLTYTYSFKSHKTPIRQDGLISSFSFIDEVTRHKLVKELS